MHSQTLQRTAWTPAATPQALPGHPSSRRRLCVSLAGASAGPLERSVPALKEWAALCEALGAGDQTVLIRKGGIREPTFKPRAAEFLLVPTSFHARAELLQPGVAERYHEAMALEPKTQPQLQLHVLAQVTAAWTTSDARLLHALPASLHIVSPEFLQTRLNWRRGQPLTLIEIRAWRLQTPVVLQNHEELWGCFSWVNVPMSSAGPDVLADKLPVLDDGVFAEKQARLRAALRELEVTELALPQAEPSIA